jgi:hypothetical protein
LVVLAGDFGFVVQQAKQSITPDLVVFLTIGSPALQVSFLHVYHHFSIAWGWWVGLRLYPGGDAYFGALLNSVIHVLMYSYYTLSLLRISCPWKKYLTQLQLLQFITVIVYSIFSVQLLPTGCSWRYYVAYVVQGFEMSVFALLFAHFYIQTYRRNEKKKEAAAAAKAQQERSTETRVDGTCVVKGPLPEPMPSSSSSSTTATAESIVTDSDSASDSATEQASVGSSSSEEELIES